MTDTLRAAKLARKRRSKWWHAHPVLLNTFVVATLLVSYVGFGFLNREMPRWLAAMGVGPSGINLLLGTVWCAVGAWGIRTFRNNGMGITLMYGLCLLGGILALAKAFALV